MKTSIWDILTGITLLGILCMVGAFGAILLNPGLPFNPFRPAAIATVAPISIPTATSTIPGLPPTWTPAAVENNTEAPALDPTLRPSSTPVPTYTAVVLPTFTPFPTRRPGTSGSSGSSGSSSGGVGGGNCQITYQNPPDDAILPRDQSFDMHWTIKNTSSKTWRSDSVDIRFMSGDDVDANTSPRDMPYDVPEGKTLDLLIHMNTPSVAGTYNSNWALVEGSTPVCKFFVQFRIQ